MTERNNHTLESRNVTVMRSDGESKGEFKLIASRDIPSGSSLFKIEGAFTEVPTRYSVQVGRGLHIDIPESESEDSEETMDRFYWRFMNHSCEPNTLVRGQECFALKPIEAGQEIVFNYNTTEYEMAEPFDCLCGSKHCTGRIRGFRFLSC